MIELIEAAHCLMWSGLYFTAAVRVVEAALS